MTTQRATGDRALLAVLATGIVGGLASAAYVAALTGLKRLLWPTHWSRGAHWLLFLGVGGAIAVVFRFFGDAGETDLLVDNIHVGADADLRPLRSLIPASLLGVAVGGGIGPEAPLSELTGTLGSWIGHQPVFAAGAKARRMCAVAGMAAGFTVLFGAPLGGAVFAVEILHRRGLNYDEALLPAAVGAVSGYLVFVAATHWGLHPVWRFPAPPRRLHLGDLGWAAACGLIGAALAGVFTGLTYVTRWLFAHVPRAVRPVGAAALLGATAFVSPWGLTYAEDQIGHVALLPKVAVATLLLAVLGHLLSATVTMAGEWRGGFIIPLFFMGLCLGRVLHTWVPGTNEVVVVTALMVACNVGVTKTPLGSALVVAAMAGVEVLPTMLLASLVALACSSLLGRLDSHALPTDTSGVLGTLGTLTRRAAPRTQP